MQENEVLAYLKDNPDFFETNASFLADVSLPSPHGEGAISLAERQQLAQRDKINALQERFAELVLNAEENDKIANKMHEFAILLQQAKDFDTVEQLISHHLPEDFNITDTYLRIWENPLNPVDAENLVFNNVPETIQGWVNDVHNVYCGEAPTSIVIDDWFIEPAASVAALPLRNEKVYGFLALSSEQQDRFYVGMGTDFLQKLGDHVSAALSRYVEANE
jgi:uncharacterized protein YigA (DUF484 family)